MLAVNAYAPDHVAACRNRIAADIAAYEAASPPAALDPVFYGMMVMALDHWFCHRQRSIEGKDGNPLNEVRVLCRSIMENDGVMVADNGIKLDPARSVLGPAVGHRIEPSAADVARMADAFLAEIERRFV
jgi:hypothetical protein